MHGTYSAPRTHCTAHAPGIAPRMHCLLAQEAAPLAAASVDHAALDRVGLRHAFALAPHARELLSEPTHTQEDGGGWLRLGVRRRAQQRAATLEAAHRGEQDGRGELGGDTWFGLGLGLGLGFGFGLAGPPRSRRRS